MQAQEARFLLKFFAPQLAMESAITRKLLAAIPENQREYRPDPKSRSAMELAWHLASSEIWFLDGILNGSFGSEEEKMPGSFKTVADVIQWYDSNVPGLTEKLGTLSDEQLTRKVPFFGVYNLAAVAYLSILVAHSIHHRGQLSAYLRPMGAKVPAIYGGSADEPFEMAALSGTSA
jgi:uncharacterized damage-inducible protein DinB